MADSSDRQMPPRRLLKGRWGITGAVIASVAGWLSVAVLVSAVSLVPPMGWRRVAILTVLCGVSQGAVLAGRHLRFLRRIRATIPRPVLEQRLHGDLDGIVDSEGRPLRPIGTTAGDVVSRTGLLLGQLIAMPSVRIFHGVRAQHPYSPLVAHAVAAGRTVILVESVAWPPGRYRMDGHGRIRCDGLYIGQSVGDLLAAVRHWRDILPRGHRVSAVVVVHATGDGAPLLPSGTDPDLTWVGADRALADLRQRVNRRGSVSTRLIAALIAATASGTRA